MTPISKSGDTSEASNYRPISLLSLISKILERCFHNSVIDFLLEHNLLLDCQYGFRPKSSTLDALLTITRDWHQSLSTGRQVAAVFFDIKKAFDSVPHSNLLQALANIGITGELHQWFANYLTGRYQRVVLDGFSSSYQPVTSGVPQGSILGPLLYIIFMNSISKLPLSPGAKLVLYADDILCISLSTVRWTVTICKMMLTPYFNGSRLAACHQTNPKLNFSLIPDLDSLCPSTLKLLVIKSYPPQL